MPLLTTSLILGKAVEDKIIDETQANRLWEKMLEKNRNLPDNSFSNYYLNKYEIDLDDFFVK